MSFLAKLTLTAFFLSFFNYPLPPTRRAQAAWWGTSAPAMVVRSCAVPEEAERARPLPHPFPGRPRASAKQAPAFAVGSAPATGTGQPPQILQENPQMDLHRAGKLPAPAVKTRIKLVKKRPKQAAAKRVAKKSKRARKARAHR